MEMSSWETGGSGLYYKVETGRFHMRVLALMSLLIWVLVNKLERWWGVGHPPPSLGMNSA